MPGHQVFALMILTIGDLSAHRIAILVNIRGAHEYGNLQPLVFKIFFVYHFLNDHYFLIIRADIVIDADCKFEAEYPEKVDAEQHEDKVDKSDESRKRGRGDADKIKRVQF